ncbi:NAD(P)-binding domain-containing protein [Acaryochloris sp. IP29b_bin.137]|uniref:flavin-containing monooxygenase n=1 Tax=Acaryochloris sp. IP29b_bin.137 TaxID=2969217 RepID=UPI00261209FE|nr:NAD(P)-binding domain-containing protein [Acaryochloris sp. IP29b_bin.137]
MQTTSDKYLIIGAGFIGLGMAEALKAAGMAYDQVDASDDIGGNWHHGVYETAHIVSSKKITQFTHYPMPADYPDFPSAQNIQDYLQSFTDHFDLRQQIQLNCTVHYVRPVEHNLWEVTFNNNETRLYKGVLLCNGHHWSKRFPPFEGQFEGEIIHSKDYKHPDQLRGKRVLVIGAGNSACDIAAEAARVGAKSTISMRDSVWFIPKTFAGKPAADFMQWWMPEWFQRLLAHLVIRLAFGLHADYGLAKPKHRLFTKHPTVNTEVPYYLKHGRLTARPDVQRLAGNEVEFIDGQRDQFDLIVCATGYYVAYPFLPPELQRVEGAIVKCYGGSFLEDYKGLYFIGWSQGRSGIGSLMSTSTNVLIRFLQLQDEVNVPLGLVFKEMRQSLPTTHLVDPQKLARTMRMVQLGFPWIRYRAHQVDRQYPNFRNKPLPVWKQKNLEQVTST